jgi:drug/metabolite transporter (DMT)-like permease
VLDKSPLLWTSWVRFVAGLVTILVILAFRKDSHRIVGSLFNRQKWGYTLAGSFLGGYFALIIWLAGLKYAKVSVAAVLNQTSEVFIFIFAAIFLHEHITRPKLLAILLAFAGVIIVTLSN